MVDTDFLALIEQGAECWNRWRAAHPEIQPDLSTAYLFGLTLAGYDLSSANLARACLIGANLRTANLSGANLSGAYASSADFSRATLSGADLSRGNFGEANFSEADLSNARASGANFASANLSGACLAGWQVDPTTALSDLRGSHVYLGLDGQQRRPQTGQFPPGALTALLQPPAPKPGAVRRPRQRDRRPVLIAGGTIAAIAATGLSLTLRSNSSTVTADEQALSITAREIASVSLPCQEPEPPALPVGSVSYEYKNGAVYYGEFIDGQPADGRGIMVYPSGNRYDGEYRAGKRAGCGTFTFSNGRGYTGQFEADKFSGQGTWILENGERYIGEFKDNQCNGQGTFIFSNGSSKSGIWHQGKLLNGSLSCEQGSLDLPASPDS